MNLDPSRIREYRDRVYRMLYRVTRGDTQLCEDLTQQTFERLLEELEAGKRPRVSMLSWMMGIAYKLFLRECRRRRRAPVVAIAERSDPDYVAMGTLDASPETHARVAEVEAAINGLPAQQREAFVLTHVYGMTMGEAADALEVAVGTVKSRSHRAHRAIVSLLKPPSSRRAQS
jgi:RNA polymerase sigma-70 factor (ECF subfamily)